MVPATSPMYWSVRRELWENRSIYIAPLAVAAVFLLGFAISAIRLPDGCGPLGPRPDAATRRDCRPVRHGCGSDHG